MRAQSSHAIHPTCSSEHTAGRTRCPRHAPQLWRWMYADQEMATPDAYFAAASRLE